MMQEQTMRKQINAQRNVIQRNCRNWQREKQKWEWEFHKKQAQIKKLALMNQHAAAKAMAQDMARTKTAILKLEQSIGRLNAVCLKFSGVNAMNEMANAMGNVGTAMNIVNNNLDLNKLQSMSRVMVKEDAKLEMKQEMWGDVLDEIGGEVDEEETDEIYRNVLREAGCDWNDLLPKTKA